MLHSFRHPWPIPFLHSHGFFAKSFGLPRPNYHIFYSWVLLVLAPTPFTNSFLWAPLAHLCLFSTSYDFLGLTTSFSGAPSGSFAFFKAFLLFHGPMYHYSYHSGLMIFLALLILLSSSFVILLDFFLSLALFLFLPKWASTTVN